MPGNNRIAFMLLAGVLWLTGDEAGAQVAMEPVPPTPVAAQPEAGARLYRTHCVQCHGPAGAGDGPAADRVYPRPRDFTLALFKIRSTPSGSVPTDHDLFRVISEGLPGTSMPPWKKVLSEEERWQLVHHVKTFDTMGIFADEPAKERVALGPVPEVTTELIQKGQKLYESKKCWQCHGRLGRGDGPSAEGMKDDWGHPIRPVNFTKSWRFRGSDRLEDIFRTFSTGLNGTPMPSFADTLPEAADRWALAAYVRSLARPQRTSQVLRAQRHAGEIPDRPDDPAWEQTEFVDFPLAGQIILEPRWFTPAHDVVTARALYNDREVALLVEWDDGSRNEGNNGRPPDRVTVQWSLEEPAAMDGEKPYFVLGDRKHGVELWEWSGDERLERRRAHGAERMEPIPVAALQAKGTYRDGQYRVIFRHPRTGSEGQPLFTPGRFTPMAFQLRDGNHGEEGLKMALSAWYDLLLIPETPRSVYGVPLLLALLTLLGEVWLVRRLRRPVPLSS